MLVLSRREHEKIILYNNDTKEYLCTITTLDIRGREQVRLGFDAPQHIIIDREEVYQEKVKSGEVNPHLDK